MSEPKRTTIKLQFPIMTTAGVTTELVLRDPNMEDFLTLDEPWTYQETAGGRAIPIDHGPTIAMYMERCLVEPKSHLPVMQQCTIQDTFAIKKWLGRFFTAGAEVKPDSTTSSPTSSTDTAA